MHDPLRDAWWGIAISGHGTVHNDSDSIHSSNLPPGLQKVQPLSWVCSAVPCPAAHGSVFVDSTATSALLSVVPYTHQAACIVHAAACIYPFAVCGSMQAA